MTLYEYVKSKGCRVETMAQKLHVSKTVLYAYGNTNRKAFPQYRTIEKVVNALKEMGYEASVSEALNVLTKSEKYDKSKLKGEG